MFQAFSLGLLGPADMVPSLQDSVLEGLSEIFYCQARDLVGQGHWQGWMSTMIQEEGCLTQGQVY